MIRLVDLLRMQGVTLEHYKIHLATAPTPPTIFDIYIAGNFKEWQEDQTKKNFKCDMVLSLVHIRADRWLFAGVYKILGVGPGSITKFKYKTQLITGHEELIGRIIVKYKREGRASYIWGSKYGAKLEVAEIFDSAVSIEPFPGYNNICISHNKLVILISKEEPSWKSALSSVGGIYLIIDIGTGKKYIGSAYGEGGVWQRWKNYARTGHGGNAELRNLQKSDGKKYPGSFQYSLLEIADIKSTKEQVCERESYWKRSLLSREFGFNSN